jgi:hypothetical protein
MKRILLFVPAMSLFLALLLGVCLLWAPVHAQDKSARTRTQWEYKVVQVADNEAKIEETLNKLGMEGWECITTASRGPDRGPHLICKRPKR